MNTNLKNLLFILLAVCMLFQCKQEVNTPLPELGAARSSHPFVVTAKEAQNLALHGALEQPSPVSRTSTITTGPSKRIKSVRTLNDDDGNPLMHIIHFESDTQPDAGFVIIAGDKRVVPILAKGDSGTFDPDGANPGPGIWIELLELGLGKHG